MSWYSDFSCSSSRNSREDDDYYSQKDAGTSDEPSKITSVNEPENHLSAARSISVWYTSDQHCNGSLTKDEDDSLTEIDVC